MRTIIFLLICLMAPSIFLNTWASTAWSHPIDMAIICKIESNCDDNAVGSAGEIGRYQISPVVLKHFENSYSRFGYGSVKNKCYDKYNETEKSYQLKEVPCRQDHLLDSDFNKRVADWYFDWIHERTGTVDDDLICWNWGYGNWLKWKRKGSKFSKLPKTTQAYLKRYEELGKED